MIDSDFYSALDIFLTPAEPLRACHISAYLQETSLQRLNCAPLVEKWGPSQSRFRPWAKLFVLAEMLQKKLSLPRGRSNRI